MKKLPQRQFNVMHTLLTKKNKACLAVMVFLSAACSSNPKPANWQLQASGAVEQSVAAYLEGYTRTAALEFARARHQISSTGRPDLLAQAELLRCASQVASLVFEPCSGFETLRADALVAQRAYADYLSAALPMHSDYVALLPTAQKAALLGGGAATAAVTNPLSQLVAAGVAFQSGLASPALVQMAVDTASAQGWRRPLLAWLSVQASLLEKSGDISAAQRTRRRMALVQSSTVTGAGR